MAQVEKRRATSLHASDPAQKATPHRRKTQSLYVKRAEILEEEECSPAFYTMTGELLASSPPVDDDVSTTSFLKSVRFQICLLLCGAMFLMSFINISLGMAIVCMTSDRNDIVPTGSDSENSSATDPSNTTEKPCVLCPAVHVAWSTTVQGLVLSSISWGRLVTPFAGLLVDRCNAKVIIAISLLIASISTALIPISAGVSSYLVMVLRIITGLCDAAIQPSLNKFICLWFPLQERNFALSISTAGRQFAILVAFPFAGFLCMHQEISGGWPVVFYSAIAITGVWLPLWIGCSSQNPLKHRKVQSTPEMDHIRKNTHSESSKKRLLVPWRAMLTSVVLWADIFAILCHEIPFNVMFIFLPAYVKEVLNLSFLVNGVVSTLPAVAFVVIKIATGKLSGHLERKFQHSRTKFMKIFNTIASLLMGTFLIAASYTRCCQVTLILTLLTLAIGTGGLHTGGCLGTVVSIAPRFAGTIAGLTFFMVGVSSLLSPVVVRWIVPTGGRDDWGKVFLTIGVIALSPISFFNIWGSGDEQYWSNGVNRKVDKLGEKRKIPPLSVKTIS